jgi:hypothetical protein
MPNFELFKSGATSLSTAAKKVVGDTSLASGLGLKADINALTGKLGNQLAATAGQLAGNLPGVSGLLSNFKSELKINLGNVSAADEGKKVKNIVAGGDPPFPNILSQFASYNYIVTLSCLDDESLNFPDSTYRAGKFNTLILASGSINPDNRVNTAFGKFDFFMDDISIVHQCAFSKDSGNTNMMGFKFKVLEPYSMGIFPQAMQKAAIEAGHPSYLGTAPFLLTIDFSGHTADQLAKSLPRERRLFPFTLMDMTARVTAKGTEYEVTGNPYNYTAFNAGFNTIPHDTTISGQTVQEMLQTGEKSLQRVLNDYLVQRAKENKEEPDEIIIMFPEDPSSPLPSANETINKATRNPKGQGGGGDIYDRLKLKKGTGKLNQTYVQEEGAVNSVGKSSMGFSSTRAGDSPFGKDNAVYDAEKGIYQRGNLQIDVTTSDFRFLQSTDVTNVINQVIIMSDYAKQALRDSQADDAGMLPWWRIDPQVYQGSSYKNLGKTGRKPQLIVYRVVAYKVNASVLIPPNSAPPGILQLKKEALKEYNYIYTGKNTEIIDFQITMNNNFRKAVSADGYKDSADVKQAKQSNQEVADEDPKTASEDTGSNRPPPDAQPRQVSRNVTNTSTDGRGGGGLEDISTRLARNFMDAVTEGADMLETTLKVHGDPYFLGDSGIGNYTSPETNYRMINSDGSMNYQNTEVYIIVNFRTPTDVDPAKGTYNSINGSGELVQAYSGLYKILQVESNFSGGKFTQVLSLNRQTNQELAGKVPEVAMMKNQDEGPPVIADLEDDDGSQAQAAVEAAAAEEYPNGAPSLSDQEIAANNASLGDFNG